MATASLNVKKPEKERLRAGQSGISAREPEEIIQTSFRLPRGRWTKLQLLGIEERLSIQSIIVSALEAEFKRRGKSF